MISRAVLAVLIGLAAQASRPACAQLGGELNEYLAVKENAPLCINQSLAPAKRIVSCTTIINLAQQGSYVASRDIGAIYVARATAYQQQGDDPSALRDLQTALQKEPGSDLPWLALGTFYMAHSKYPQALENYERAVKIAGKDPVAYDDRGATLAALRRNDEAIADFTHALDLDGRDTTARSNRATLYLTTNRPDLAIADLTKVIGAEPTNFRAFYNRGAAYERTGALAMAAEDYRSSGRLKPTFAPAYEALGRVLARTDPQAALSELSEAVRLDPHSSALRSRAILYLSLRRFEPAISDLDRVIAADDTDNIAYLDRGVAEENLGNLERALADYSRSIELDTTAAALIDRGSVYARMHQPYKARADFDTALALEPDNVAALIGRADVNYASGEHDAEGLAQSLDDYTRVIEAAPKNAAAYFTRGNIHFDRGEFLAAYGDYSASLELDANQPSALFNRSLAAERLGRSAQAARDRSAARKLDSTLAIGADSDAPQRAAAATQLEYATGPIGNDAPRVAFAVPRAATAAAPAGSAAAAAQSASAPETHPEVTITGYRRITVNGKERFCRTEQTLGSHLEKSTTCLTRRQLEAEREDSRRFMQQIERTSGIGVTPYMYGGGMAPH